MLRRFSLLGCGAEVYSSRPAAPPAQQLKRRANTACHPTYLPSDRVAENRLLALPCRVPGEIRALTSASARLMPVLRSLRGLLIGIERRTGGASAAGVPGCARRSSR